MEGNEMNPLTLYQGALDTVSAATLKGDFESYAAMIDFPYLLCTRTENFLLLRPEDLLPTFRNLSGALADYGVTDYIRLAHEADYAHPDRIDGWHVTHILVGDQRVIAPWAARQSIVRRDGIWRFSEAHYPFLSDSLPLTSGDFLTALRSGPPPLPGMAALPARKAR
jgi:hypothetical protein